MRFTLYYNILLVAVFALLPFAVGAQEQLVFDHTTWNFGEIAEQNGKVEHTFTFENRSSRPIVIVDVVSGCGCTTPSYSRKPILVGQGGEIKVAFDPMNRPGKFSKGVSVMTSISTKPVTLMLEGNVSPREKSVEELYPFDLGGGVRLAINFHSFAYVGRGERVSERIGWINTSGRDVALKLLPKQSSGMARVEAPAIMKAGEKGDIVISYEVAAESNRYGTLEDMFGLQVNGREASVIVTMNAIAVDKFDRLTEDILQPSCELSKKIIKFGEIKQGKTVTNASLSLVNNGESDLIIRAVEWNTNALNCSLKAGDRVKAGEQIAVKLTLDTSDCNHGVWVDRLRIITNDPARPMQTMRVTAIVVD